MQRSDMKLGVGVVTRPPLLGYGTALVVEMPIAKSSFIRAVT
jgi:hypothetical protein